MAENNKKDSFNFPPVGGKNNRNPKFSSYWSFIVIAAFIIGFQFFSMPRTRKGFHGKSLKRTSLPRER